MEELRVELKDKKYPIYIGYDILKKFLKNYRDNYSSSFIITHSFLYDLYKEDLEISQEGIIYVPVGEKSKSFKEVIRISRELAQRGADRKSAIFAFGGES